jgi:2-amino-4-hydroxy-6-hydroxymethyldihydropteridine diphosphokinase
MWLRVMGPPATHRASVGAAAASRRGRAAAMPSGRLPPEPTRTELPAMREPVTAFVGLGANLGDPQRALVSALRDLGALQDTELVRSSRIYLSVPVDAGGPDYFNAVAELRTRLTAPGLLRALQAIEQAAGRERPYRNAPRTLDLDLLLYGDGRIASVALTVPHPRMRERAFVLLPLAELAPDRVSEADLQAVAAQRIAPLPPASSPA